MLIRVIAVSSSGWGRGGHGIALSDLMVAANPPCRREARHTGTVKLRTLAARVESSQLGQSDDRRRPGRLRTCQTDEPREVWHCHAHCDGVSQAVLPGG